MILYQKNDGTPQALPALDYDAAGQPWTDLANDQEARTACGWEEAPPQPDYDPETEIVEWIDGDWAVNERPPVVISLEEVKSSKRAAANSEFDSRIANGYPHTFMVEGEGVDETLQCRNDTDRTNWLDLKDSCNDAIAFGIGSETCPIPIRCTSNRQYNVSFSEAATIMRDLRTWMGALHASLWAKKDAIEAASTFEELDEIDVTEGWPT